MNLDELTQTYAPYFRPLDVEWLGWSGVAPGEAGNTFLRGLASLEGLYFDAVVRHDSHHQLLMLSLRTPCCHRWPYLFTTAHSEVQTCDCGRTFETIGTNALELPLDREGLDELEAWVMALANVPLLEAVARVGTVSYPVEELAVDRSEWELLVPELPSYNQVHSALLSAIARRPSDGE